MKNFGIARLYQGESGKIGYYNSQEIGLSRAMKKLGYCCYIFYPSKELTQLKEEQVEKNITIIYCPSKSIGVHGHYNWNIISKYNIDLLEIESDNQLFAPNLIKYCSKNNIQFFNYIGTIESDSNNALKRTFLSFFVKNNIKYYKKTKCFAKTNEVKKGLLKKGVNDVEILHVGLDLSIIPNDIDIKKTINEYYIPSNKKKILFVGRMEEYKKPLLFLQLLKNLGEDYFGIMVGTGSLDEKVEQEIKNSNIVNVLKINKVKNIDIHGFYKIADYFVNLNEIEIFGMSMLEAMYQGCNVIAIRSPGACEIIRDQETGYLSNSVKEIEEIIINNNKLNVKTIKDNVINNFTWDIVANKVDKILNQ